MSRADVGDHRDVRLCATGETLDLAGATHAHLNHKNPVITAGLQERQRHSDVVVVVGGAGLYRSQCRQSRSDQFAGGGLAGGARHRHKWCVKCPAMQQAQLLIGLQRVFHPPVQQTSRQLPGPATLHKGALGSTTGQLA